MTPPKKKKTQPKQQHRRPAKKSPRKSPRKDERKAARKAARPVSAPPAENPKALALARRIAELVADKKALDVVVLDVRGKTSYADYFVIASGESERQVAAMADHVTDELKKEGERPIGTEGQQTGQWVLLDFGEVVAHLFYADIRTFYDLEGLWADAPRDATGAGA
ncbi:MAG: ribosome silencing factor [Myxococcaceae bacterium]